MMKSLSVTRIIQWMTCLVLFLLPWQTVYIVSQKKINQFVWVYGTQAFYLVGCLIWVLIALFLFFCIQKFRTVMCSGWYKKCYYVGVARVSCIVLWLYIFFSVFWALDPSLALQHNVYFFGAVLLGAVIIFGPTNLGSIIVSFLSGSLVQAFMSFWQVSVQEVTPSTLLGIAAKIPSDAGTSVIHGLGVGRWLRAYAGLPHPNIFGGLMCFSLILLIGCVFFWYQKSARSSKILMLSAVVILFLGLWVSFSRAAIIAFFTWFFLLGVYLFSTLGEESDVLRLYRKIFFVIVCALVYGVLVFFPQVMTRVGVSSVYELRSVVERVDGYTVWAEMVSEYFWFGTGFGGYTVALQNHLPELPGWVYQPVHNTFLLVFFEMGFVGFVVLLFFLAFVLKKIVQVLQEKKVLRPYMLVGVFLSPVMVIGLLDHYLFSLHVGLLMVFVYLGVLVRSIVSFPQLVHYFYKKS